MADDNPFTSWKTNPGSIVSGDRRFIPQGKSGQSMSQIGQRVVAERTKKLGRNPGTIQGMRKKDRG